jgi:hypothetical protein
MYQLICITVAIIYILLLIFAIMVLINHFICDEHTCNIFTYALKNVGNKSQVIFLLNHLCEDNIWPYAFITSSIISFLFFSILPIDFNLLYFIVTFFLSWLIFYALMSFLLHHYVIPIKDSIINFIKNN